MCAPATGMPVVALTAANLILSLLTLCVMTYMSLTCSRQASWRMEVLSVLNSTRYMPVFSPGISIVSRTSLYAGRPKYRRVCEYGSSLVAWLLMRARSFGLLGFSSVSPSMLTRVTVMVSSFTLHRRITVTLRGVSGVRLSSPILTWKLGSVSLDCALRSTLMRGHAPQCTSA